MFIKTEDPDLPAFYFDPLINPISHKNYTKENEIKIDDPEDFELPQEVVPFFEDMPLYTDHTANGIILFFSGESFKFI